MEWTDFEDFLPYVLNEVPGCPAPVCETFIRKFAIRLCEKAQILSLDASEIHITADQVIYPLNFSQNLFKAISINYASYSESDTSMEKTSEAYLDSAETNWRSLTVSTRPRSYFLTLDNKFHVYQKPTADVDDDPIIANCVVKPVRTATKVPEEIFENYAEVIAYGALSELQLMQQQSWYNMDLANRNAKMWRSGVRNARANKVRGYDGEKASGAYPKDFYVMD